ncbi:MFS-type transporter dbaD [Cladobotryum mycophilum]|uniref:MFS-type transporter dbaD n=1 Tax=Cladobotryum mycophilum TaxID=491253 RepID=A0ABR0SQ65_9HYPO
MAAEKDDSIRANRGLKTTTRNVQTVIESGSLEYDEPKEDIFAWLQVLGAFVLNLNTWGMMNSYGVFQTFYQLDLLRSHTSSEIAWIGSTQAFLMSLISIIAGPLFDAGHLSSLLSVGSILLVLGMMLASISTRYWEVFLSQGVMMGLGFGCLYLPAPAVVSQYFDARTALAMGAASTGAALGGVIYPIAFTQLQPRLGFGWATRVLGFILLGTSLLPLLMMRSRAPPRSMRGLDQLVDRTAFRDAPYLLLNLGLFFGLMGIYVVLYYIELFALYRTDVSATLSNWLLVIINTSSLLGRLSLGHFADRLGSINVQTTVGLASAVLTFCLLAIRTVPSLVVYSVLYGFAAGAFMALPAAGVISLSEDKSKIGTRLGMTLGFVGVGVLVSNPIAGAILGDGQHQDWVGVISWCGALMIASGLALVASRVMKIGWGWSRVI